jgi:tRNA modification GTPase
MSVFAAAMTGEGTGAISSIGVFGDGSGDIIRKIFTASVEKIGAPEAGGVAVGMITDGEKTIDQVTVGCEGKDIYAINCHGNPLIVEMIMGLLKREGAELVSAEEMLIKTLSAQEGVSTISLEARLALPKARTIEGTKIIANQIEDGLSSKAGDWLEHIDATALAEIKLEAERILQAASTAKLIMYGCKAVIAGPPNSGKSTLLNCLCGRQKAIVTDVRGTTRDWVSGRFQVESLSVELVDTAGLDEKPTHGCEDTIAKKAQERTRKILEEADLVLLVLDGSEPAEKLDEKLLARIRDKRVLTVLNKSDLPGKLNESKLPAMLSARVRISAKSGEGTEELREKIRQICGVAGFDLRAAVCVTDRQEKLLKQLKGAESKDKAVSIITELLNGRLVV